MFLPELHWSSPPPGTKSLALIVEDPDAPGKPFAHWVVFNIPGTVNACPETAPPEGGTVGQNDSGSAGY